MSLIISPPSLLTAFKLEIGQAPRILILGTMPGARSLAAEQYYAHPQNHFWRLMGDIYGFDFATPYDARIKKLKQSHIALWDVLHQCERKGSLDSDIKNALPNDFEKFFKQYPSVEKVIFNSGVAEKIFKKHYKHLLDNGITYLRVPSPSPAHATRNYDEKLALWKQALLG